jgi:hypothetical protein
VRVVGRKNKCMLVWKERVTLVFGDYVTVDEVLSLSDKSCQVGFLKRQF